LVEALNGCSKKTELEKWTGGAYQPLLNGLVLGNLRIRQLKTKGTGCRGACSKKVQMKKKQAQHGGNKNGWGGVVWGVGKIRVHAGAKRD